MSSRRVTVALLVAVVLVAAAACAGFLVGRSSELPPSAETTSVPAASTMSATVSPAPAAQASATPADTGVSECGQTRPVSEPDELTMTCADGGVVLHDMSWQYWGEDVAVGVGSVRENSCDPNCADGFDVNRAVVVTLSAAQPTGAGRQFTKATVAYQDTPAAAAGTDAPQAVVYDVDPYTGG